MSDWGLGLSAPAAPAPQAAASLRFRRCGADPGHHCMPVGLGRLGGALSRLLHDCMPVAWGDSGGVDLAK